MATETTYRYLGRGGEWPGFELSGVAVAPDGSLRLAPLPALDEVVSGDIPPLPGLEGPAGVGVDQDGNVYIADPGTHRILRVDGCDGTVRPLPCLRGPGRGIGELRFPRGVAVDPRGWLYIADSGNARIQVVDLDTQQIRGVIGGRRPAVPPGPPRSPGRFHEPWDVAVDRRGRLYVADPGEALVGGERRLGSLQRFSKSGAPDLDFARVLGAQEVVPAVPSSVTIALLPLGGAAEERIFVLDQDPARILVFRIDGTYDPEGTRLWARAGGEALPTGSITFGQGRLYVTAPGGRVLVFGDDGAFHGSVRTEAGHASGLGLDCEGRLFVHPGEGGVILRAGAEEAHSECGAFLAGPFSSDRARTLWQRLRLLQPEELPEGAHLRLFTLTSDCLDGSPGFSPILEARAPGTPVPERGLPLCELSWASLPPCSEPMRHAQLGTPGEVPRGEWAPSPWDTPDLEVPNEPARYLWIAGIFQGDGRVSPTLGEIRVDHDRDGWFRRLPGVYRRDAESRAFLDPLLLLFETVHEGSADLIDDLPRLFDAEAAPDSPERPWLDWLAGWFDLPLVETWPEPLRRETTGRAFEMQGRRGTLASLRERIRLYAGAQVEVIDAARTAGVWVLGATPFGRRLRLASAEAQGAVLGTTATVDRSHLIRSEEFGVPLFDGIVHCFTVLVHRTDLRREDSLARIREVIEQEKPAHTVYRLCVIEPRMRVGFQATLGVDTIVGGPPRVAAWDGSRRLGEETVLPSSRRQERGEARIGDPVTTGFTLA